MGSLFPSITRCQRLTPQADASVWIVGQLPPYIQPNWGVHGCSGQSWFPASTSPLAKVSISLGGYGGDALLTVKITHSTFP